MVKILANGEIVPDDDPRARSTTTRNSNSNSVPRNRNNQGGIPPLRQGGGGGVQQGSIFQTVNQTLLGYGIPRWNIGDTIIEPIVSVGLVLAVVFFGVQGLLFGLLLFAVSQWSNNGPPEFVGRLFGTQGGEGRQQRGSQDSNRGSRGGAGGGHRLGRD